MEMLSDASSTTDLEQMLSVLVKNCSENLLEQETQPVVQLPLLENFDSPTWDFF